MSDQEPVDQSVLGEPCSALAREILQLTRVDDAAGQLQTDAFMRQLITVGRNPPRPVPD